MQYVIGVILLLTFFGLAYYCIKGHNLMIGFLVITIIWTVLPLLGTLFVGGDFLDANEVLKFGASHPLSDGTTRKLVDILNGIYQSAPEGWGTTLVNVCWGAWFGRVLMDTGIASTLIRKTVELGGDKPIITVTLLNIVTAIIFTSMTGAGPVIAIGVIVLPIMMSLGVPKAIALFSFMGSVAAGIYLNPVNFAQYRAFFIEPSQMPDFTLGWYARHWGYAALVIMLVVTTILTAVYLKKNKTSHAWAAQTRGPQAAQKDAPLYTLILPVVPVALNIAFNFSVIGGFVIAGFAALFLCGRMKGTFKENCQLVNKLYYDGVVDTAPLVGFLLTLPMFNSVAKYASPYFKVILGGVMPKNELVVCIVFAVLLGLGLFRGPMTLVGCGAATLGVLQNVASFSVPFLYGVFAIPTITVNIGSCITQSWVAWGLAYTKVESKDFLKLSIPNAYVTGIIQYAAVYLLLGGLGAQWFI
ncbi:citrate transporter [Eubacterium pyruvativorans]|uniref:citrate transporter n=1 Tax=Eubacterium pyruvativorans TaxID=155865 RepID=UPI000EF0606A|nr:citrate transporter [Eubacterium pyruvativorans]HAP73582.1 citrate transporter [Lachnospiraceae bacterium]